MKIWAILLTLAVCYGQPAAPGPAKLVIGEVTSIDASAKTIHIKADNTGTAYTINLDEKTSFLRVPPGEKDLKKASILLRNRSSFDSA